MEIMKMSIDDLMDSYDPITIEGYCKQCPKYATFWSCPPFDFDVEKWLLSYQYFYLIIASTKIQDDADTMEAFDEFRASFSDKLLQIENTCNGYSMYAGSCLLCKTCTRMVNKPCLYPQRMRRSLEAVGISVSDLLKKSTKQKLTWGKDGELKTVMGLLSNEAISIETIRNIMEA